MVRSAAVHLSVQSRHIKTNKAINTKAIFSGVFHDSSLCFVCAVDLINISLLCVPNNVVRICSFNMNVDIITDSIAISRKNYHLICLGSTTDSVSDFYSILLQAPQLFFLSFHSFCGAKFCVVDQ